MLPTGRTFYKMSGSGNDFVILDATRAPAPEFLVAATVQSICARATGIGAGGRTSLIRGIGIGVGLRTDPRVGVDGTSPRKV